MRKRVSSQSRRGVYAAEMNPSAKKSGLNPAASARASASSALCPAVKRPQLGPVVVGQRHQRIEVVRDPANRHELLLRHLDLLSRRQAQIGDQTGAGLRHARPRLIEPHGGQPRSPAWILKTSRSLVLPDVVGQLVLGRFQRAAEPVDDLVEEALEVPRQQEPFVDSRHLEGDVGALHPGLRLPGAQTVRRRFAAQGDLAEGVERLDDA